ncbi:hypothetical protein HJC23_011894 [Cyclotella cryptica]|uniref:Uncharacterized protein n=1 Tax=Cyclotella cryptica TaxID=29204 RepID=A0ABD3PJU2_9STRA|eukprot:CCRYP_013854-RA/>CCRYP_013854-RA protein AED:0.00 eAED:0.00 QI:56/-1/1/1/-1/1/1/167/665
MSLSRCCALRPASRHGHRRLLSPSPRPPLLPFAPHDTQKDNDDGNNNHNGQTPQRVHRTTTWHSFHSVTTRIPRTAHANVTTAPSHPKRSYHHTPTPQILPVIVLGAGIAAAVYSYRALRQMDAEWDEYYERLDEYEAAMGPNRRRSRGGENVTASAAAHFTGGTLAVDLGSSYLKLAHCRPLIPASNRAGGRVRPEVVVDREGFRSIPALVWMPSSRNESGHHDHHQNDNQHEETALVVGRMAAARRYDSKGGRVVSARDALRNNHDDNVVQRGVYQSIRVAASNALEQVLGGDTNRSSLSALSTAPLFVLDPSMAVQGAYNARPVFTYPPSDARDASSHLSHDSNDFLQKYKHVIQHSFVSPKDIALFVPEPVAAMTGAEYYNLLPQSSSPNSSSTNHDNKPVVVVDVGGTITQVSIVSTDNQQYRVVYSSSMPWGAETFVDLLTRHLIHCFYGHNYNTAMNHDNNDNDNNHDSAIIPSTKPTLNDPTALQRLYDASTTAMQELSRKTRCQINIPYLSIDMQTRQPKHLEVDVARSIIDAEVESFLRDELVSYLLQNSKSSTNTILSKNLPPPTDLSTLFSSVVASAMEQTFHTPQSLCAILLVGGGSRIPLVRQAMRRGVANLGGDMFLEQLVMPEGEMGMELTALGAALWGGGGGGSGARM